MSSSSNSVPSLLILGLLLAGGAWTAPLDTAVPELGEAALEALLDSAESDLPPASPGAEDSHRFRNQVERTSSNTFVLTREQIRAVNPKHPAEMLRYVPGFVVLRRNQASYEISTFGTGAAQSNAVLVLLDGHRVLAPDQGRPLWDVIPLIQDDLERIEVQFGPESNLYGSNAFGAVVNFVTRSPRDEDRRLVTRSGSDSFHQVNWMSSHRTRRGGTRIMASSSHRGTVGPYLAAPSGAIDPVWFVGDRHTHGMVRVRHQQEVSDQTNLEFSVAAVQRESSGVVPSARLQQVASDGVAESLHLTMDLDRALSLSRHLSLHTSYQRIHQFFGQPPMAVAGIFENTQSTSQSEFDLRYRWEPGAWRLTTGTSLRVLGLATPYNPVIDSQSIRGFYARGEREFGDKWTVFLGARRILQESVDNVTSWKAAGLYRPRPDLGFRLSVGNSFRAPDFFGVFFRTTSTVNPSLYNPAFPNALLPLDRRFGIDNPNLVSESAERFVQASVEKRWDRRSVKLGLYRATLENPIRAQASGAAINILLPPLGIPVPLGLGQIQFRNLQTRHVRGATLTYQSELPHSFQLTMGLNLQDLDAPNFQVADPYAPPRSGSLILHRAAEGRRLGGSLTLRAVDSYGVSTYQEGPGYGVVDLNLERNLSDRTTVSLSVRNLFDHEHYEVADYWLGVPEGTKGMLWGREAFVTLRWKL